MLTSCSEPSNSFASSDTVVRNRSLAPGRLRPGRFNHIHALIPTVDPEEIGLYG
jgi:hypothetical protein